MINRILQIELHNFQAHKHTVINSDTPVLVLSGESHNGKTVIIRALSWLVTNRPTGDGFVSHWAKHENKKGARVMKSDAECSVSIDFLDSKDKKHTISRHKTSSENWYVVDGTKLSAIGTDVPKEVTRMLHLNGTNIQSQDEPYFMLNLSGSQVSAKLNELVHLDTIDTAYAFTKRAKLDASADYKHAEKEYNANKLNVLGYAYVPDARADYDYAEGLVDRHEEKVRIIEGMEDSIGLLDSLKEKMDRMPDMDAMQKDIALLDRMISDMEEKEQLHDAMKEIKADVVNIRYMKSSLPRVRESDITRLESLIKARAEKDADYDAMTDASIMLKAVREKLWVSQQLMEKAEGLDRLHDLIKEHEEITDLPDDIMDVIMTVRMVHKGLKSLPEVDAQSLRMLHDRINEHTALTEEETSIYSDIIRVMNLRHAMRKNDEQLAELEKELPDICPLCGQPLDKEHNHVK